MAERISAPDGRRRVVVAAVRPAVDRGRYPIKRVTGERVAVEADVFVDGHDVLRARLLHRHATETAWREAPLELGADDTWRGSFVVERLGRHVYTVEAFVDDFATWRRGLERKHAAGADVEPELLDGARLASRVAELSDVVALLRSDRPAAERVAVALGDPLAECMQRHPDRARAVRYDRELEVVVERPRARFSAFYEMFPRSCGRGGRHGTFRDAEARLDYVAELGFDVVYLPPIHPIGRAFRKGPDNAPEAKPGDPGSPWAVGAAEGGHTSVHPELGTLDDFDRFVRAARARGIDVALDLAFQASPDHPWVREHPSWFRARADGSIQYAENPPKKYQDVYPFDFESKDWKALWDALLGVVLFWAERGVRVFRVDNPHTKPIPFWEWCIERARSEHPDLVFLAEAFTRPKVMAALAKVGFSQSYTYFTWRTTKAEIEQYLRELTTTELVEYLRPSFWPTTPDILPEHLQHAPRSSFVSRLVLAATLSSNYGIYGPSFELMENVPRPGAEELARSEKYELRSWDLEREDSLRHVVARLNRARREHAALQDNRTLRFHATDNDRILCFSKRAEGSTVLVVVNLDPRYKHSAWVELDLSALGVEPDATYQVHDLLSDERSSWRGARNYVELDPNVMPAHLFVVRRSLRTENQFEYFL